MERIISGINGLDNLVNGGFPKGHSVLLCGAPGTGKTIFGLQFLYTGAKNHNENGLYVSIEENPNKLKAYAKEFGWKDIEKLENEKKLEFLRVAPNQRKFDVAEAVKQKVQDINAKRMVIDSLSAIYLAFEDITQFIYSFVNLIEELGVTSIFITDSPPGSNELTKDGVSEFVCDGVIHLQLHDVSKAVNRTISIKKMRGTSIIPGMNSLKFTESGLEVEEYKAFY
ncbi:AAA family ATPase [Candidatus Woesearchaeota archaeon]|nr:AAA family ATPase [Candidatus Woesearchaeota archaeon]MBI3027660.1 AAA family ATPase [Candidatus Woesearchaeota archaeon]